MATSVDQSFVKQYEAEVKEAYQRQGSLLQNTVRRKGPVNGTSTTMQKIGTGTATTKTRNGVIPPMNVDHTPVEVTLGDFYAGDWVDKLDEAAIMHDERRALVNAGAYALGRKTDELIIAAAGGASNASTQVNLSALTVQNCIDWVTQLGVRDVPVTDGEMFAIVSWQVWAKLLGFTQFSSADYVAPQDLPFGGNTFGARRWMGYIWMPHSGLTSASNVRQNLAYHRAALGWAFGVDVTTDITWHGDRAAHWVNNMLKGGAKLIDDIGVQRFPINEAA